MCSESVSVWASRHQDDEDDGERRALMIRTCSFHAPSSSKKLVQPASLTRKGYSGQPLRSDEREQEQRQFSAASRPPPPASLSGSRLDAVGGDGRAETGVWETNKVVVWDEISEGNFMRWRAELANGAMLDLSSLK